MSAWSPGVMAICWRTDEGSIYHAHFQEPCIAGGVTANGSMRPFTIAVRKRANSLWLQNRTVSRQPARRAYKLWLALQLCLIVAGAAPSARANFLTFLGSVGDSHSEAEELKHHGVSRRNHAPI